MIEQHRSACNSRARSDEERDASASQRLADLQRHLQDQLLRLRQHHGDEDVSIRNVSASTRRVECRLISLFAFSTVAVQTVYFSRFEPSHMYTQNVPAVLFACFNIAGR